MGTVKQGLLYSLVLPVTVVALWNPMLAASASAAFFVLTSALYLRPRLPQLVLGLVGFCLVGYTLLGRGFAYVGVPPLFIGEMVLALGVLAVLLAGGLGRVFRSPLIWLLVGFMVVGAADTFPYLSTYEFDALRDAVIWGYGTYAVVVAAFLLKAEWVRKVVALYTRGLPWLLLLIPVLVMVSQLAGHLLPALPPGGVPVLFLKSGDTAVHLAGAATFLMLGLHRASSRSHTGYWAREWPWWLLWMLGAVTISTSRGGLLSIIMAITLVVALVPSSRWARPFLMGTLLVLALSVANVSVDVGGRTVSTSDIFVALKSIVVSTDEGDFDGTRSWRLRWWGDIVNYTLFGDYFWTGKGYGVNLADSDGYQVEADGSLRSPHNAHLTILARGGVPGLAAWFLLQGAFALSLLRAHLRARRSGQLFWARLDLWILAYWTAFMVNATFDVYLEGPQGGICFWSLFGFGVAVLMQQRQEAKAGGAPAGRRKQRVGASAR